RTWIRRSSGLALSEAHPFVDHAAIAIPQGDRPLEFVGPIRFGSTLWRFLSVHREAQRVFPAVVEAAGPHRQFARAGIRGETHDFPVDLHKGISFPRDDPCSEARAGSVVARLAV